MRPWLDWRTIATPHFRFHFRPEYEQWTRDVAQRVESVDSSLTAFVGFASPKPIDVVVDDPYAVSNGYAIPFLDHAATVWWTTPPEPRTELGNFRTFSELLAVHELAHLSHLTRPSRNPLTRTLDASLLNLGPLSRRSPRWVFEGYATLVEGRLTGTGRPNGVQRPAILRQWAIEGRLPSYSQLNGSSDFNGGAFAYIGGSAFLEWLAQRDGDSSLVHVWRRLSARRVRTFEAAFTGVFGDPPPLLYGRHAAELTRDAMAARSALESAGLREGELIQRLSWETGDPAVSPNGERVAIVLRERGRPARVVVWKTSPAPADTLEAKRLRKALERDPLDVPDRRVYPAPKKAERTLLAVNGRSFQMPRWFSDNHRVLLARWTPRSDGAQSPALYVWDTDNGDVRRVTAAAGLLHGDPHPNGKEAVAMQCRGGHCDIAHVDLERGTITTLLEGSVRTTYHRPRYSPNGARFAASVAQDGRWRVVVADQRGQSLRPVDPDDGANRYEPQWINDDSIVVVSERGGIQNLEVIDLTGRSTRSLTRVTGAAIAPDVNRRDGSIWFLSLHSRGLDVRRFSKDAPRADTVVSITAERFGLAAARGPQPVRAFGTGPVSPARPYGLGPRRMRWVPGGFASGDGAGGFISLMNGDVIGRLNVIATGAYGEVGTMQGGALNARLRRTRVSIELDGFGFVQEPSRGRYPQLGSDSLDGRLTQGVLAFSGERRGDGWFSRARVGGAAGRLTPDLGEPDFRGLGFGEVSLLLQQSRGAQGLWERLRVHGTQGKTGEAYTRAIASLDIGTVGLLPLQLSATAGRITGTPPTFELFTVGGLTSPIGDSSVLSQRYDMPVFPTGIATGRALFAWRAVMPGPLGWLFYERASVNDELRKFSQWNSAIGLEERFAIGPLPSMLVPRAEVRVGAGYTLDEPFRKRVRAFLEMRIEP